jgi:hypothetical protein
VMHAMLATRCRLFLIGEHIRGVARADDVVHRHADALDWLHAPEYEKLTCFPADA